jgi:hypothetical protein
MIFDIRKKIYFTWFFICFFNFKFALIRVFIFNVKKNFFFERILNSLNVMMTIWTFFKLNDFIQIDIMSATILMNLNEILILNVFCYFIEVNIILKNLITALILLYFFRTCFSNSNRESRIENWILLESKIEILKSMIVSNAFQICQSHVWLARR